MKTSIVTILLMLCSYLLLSQTHYYWSSGKKQELENVSTKKIVFVDSTITDSSLLVIALNDTSLVVTGFFEFSLMPQIVLRDTSAIMVNRFAIIESRDSIEVSSLLNNNHIKYVSGFYGINYPEIYTSDLFYAKLSEIQDSVLLDSISNANNVTVLGAIDIMPLWYVLQCSKLSTGDALEMANLFYESDLFEFSHPNLMNNIKLDYITLQNTLSINDPLFCRQWGEDNVDDYEGIDINANDAWQITKGSSDIIVAVLDSGIKLNHSDLTNVDVSLSYDLLSNSSPSTLYPNLSVVLYNHGTNCAGIIGAQHNEIGIAGIAPECRLMSLSIDWSVPFDAVNSIDPIDFYLAYGIDYAWQNGADVISNSWSGAYDEDVISDAINQAAYNGRNSLGCVIVNSTGNNDGNALFPTQSPFVIGVGAVDSCGIRCTNWHTGGDEYDLMCGSMWPNGYGSNYGDGISVVAPGNNIPTTNIIDEDYITDEYIIGFKGTSAAAPHVSAVAALLLSVNPNLTNLEIKDIIEQSAQKIREDFYEYNTGYPNGTWNNKMGYGMINAYDALMMLCSEHSDILANEQITFDEPTVICETLEVSGSLIIDSDVIFTDEEPQIFVNNGGILILETGSRLLKSGNDIFDGTITVNPGGNLEIKDGAVLTLANDGKLDVLNSSSLIASLIYNEGAHIVLEDDDTYINIAGNLNIYPNAQFTFTGNGYVKFSNPGVDATFNITCGTGASVLFSGNGQTDKVLEIQQNTVHFPQLSSLTFENCKIEMGTSKRMQADYSYPVTFDNVKVTSTTGANNNHRSFLLAGQAGVTINNCIFEYGQYGIYGNLTWLAGSPLYITNSTFRYNTQGLNIYGKGLHMHNCTVTNNTTYGVYCDVMSFTSEFIDCSINENNLGVSYMGSASADVDIENTYIQSNTTDGLYTSGAFDVNMECAFVNGNQNGIKAINGTILRPYTCDLSGNTITIYLDNGSVDLYNKYNQLQAYNDYYTLYGWTPVMFTIFATHNRWESNTIATPAYLDNYYLRRYPATKPGVAVTVSDNLPSYLSCTQNNPIMSGFSVLSSENTLSESSSLENELPLLSVFGTNMPLDEAVSYLSNQCDIINSELSYLLVISQYSEIIVSCSAWSSAECSYWQNIAYGEVHNLISDFYKFVNYDKSNSGFNTAVDEIIELNETLLSNPNLKYTSFVEYKLDIALLNRMREHYTSSISQLESLSVTLMTENTESEYKFVQKWLCHIRVEKAAAEGLLSLDEFALAINDCDFCFSDRTINEDNTVVEKSYFEQDLQIEGLTGFSVSPNPNKGTFVVSLSDPCLNYEIRIINSIGQLVKSVQPTGTGVKQITIDGLTSGHFQIIYLIDNRIIDSETIIVE